jgi:hypothetical protein
MHAHSQQPPENDVVDICELLQFYISHEYILFKWVVSQTFIIMLIMKISHHIYFSCNHLDTKTNEKELNGLVYGSPDLVVTASSGHSTATSQRGNTWRSGAAWTQFAAPSSGRIQSGPRRLLPVPSPVVHRTGPVLPGSVDFQQLFYGMGNNMGPFGAIKGTHDTLLYPSIPRETHHFDIIPQHLLVILVRSKCRF